MICEETHRPVGPLMRMEKRKAAVRSVEGCVGCEDRQSMGGLVKRVRIHALGHFVLHACNCGKMFCSVNTVSGAGCSLIFMGRLATWSLRSLLSVPVATLICCSFCLLMVKQG